MVTTLIQGGQSWRVTVEKLEDPVIGHLELPPKPGSSEGRVTYTFVAWVEKFRCYERVSGYGRTEAEAIDNLQKACFEGE
jgi:hypothetical protein